MEKQALDLSLRPGICSKRRDGGRGGDRSFTLSPIELCMQRRELSLEKSPAGR